jgi:hypothetical protein
MTAYSRELVDKFVAVGLDKQRTTKDRGDALESLLCYLLGELPGIFVRRNARDPFRSMEIDITAANAQEARWMKVLPSVFLVECKNWDAKVCSKMVSEFAAKLRYRRIEAGILVATNGITGDPVELTSAYQRVALEQADGRRILVVTLDQLRCIKCTENFAELLRGAVLELAGPCKFLGA